MRTFSRRVARRSIRPNELDFLHPAFPASHESCVCLEKKKRQNQLRKSRSEKRRRNRRYVYFDFVVD